MSAAQPPTSTQVDRMSERPERAISSAILDALRGVFQGLETPIFTRRSDRMKSAPIEGNSDPDTSGIKAVKKVIHSWIAKKISTRSVLI